MIFLAEGHEVLLDFPFKKIIRRLYDMQRPTLSESLDLLRRKVAHPHSPYLPILDEPVQNLGSFPEGFQGVRPMHEKNIHVVGLQIFQGVGKVASKIIRRAIAKDMAVLPVKPGLCRYEYLIPAFFLRQSFADDFL